MPEYKAPLRDISFVLNEVLEAESILQPLPGYEEVTADLMDAIVAEGAKFSEEVLSPLNQVGDQEGCTWSEEGVKTPTGFKEAYQQYVDNGWVSLAADVEAGGQGLPNLVGIVGTEMVGSANWSWGMYPGLSHGATKTIEAHGSPEQKEKFLTRLVSGEWTGTMCLTESHCGSDLGLLRSKAEPQADGSYAITGQKIFISAGEHDMTDNIVHIVLARLPDAPEGTKGISLFIVPKVNVDDDGSLGERNAVHCASIEHKMGIHGNSTAVLNFDGARGYLIGEPNRGLNCMFTFMNTARVGTAAQGVAHMELSFQGALAYAKDRLAMRSLTGPKNPDGPADPIIVHPDVRRMLLTQKAFAEGSRVLLYFLAMQGDIVDKGNEEEAKAADDLMSLLTPIAKAFMTETGFESANHGVQVFGGHGFIQEWGMEQIVRDARISMLYEGTTGIQAMDLIGRKVLGSGGKLLLQFTGMIDELIAADIGEDEKPFIEALSALKDEWLGLSMQIGESAMSNPDEAGAAAVDYLMYSGYITLAYFWAKMALVARQKITAADGDTSFYEAKLMTARFYFERLLPRTESLKKTMLSGADNLMTMPQEMFDLA